jgi:hypothetical protein
MSGLFEPPPGREVGELSARPLGFYTVSQAKRCYSIALRYTENKGYSQSSILTSPLIPRLVLVRRYTYIYIYSNACLEMSALVCRVPTLQRGALIIGQIQLFKNKYGNISPLATKLVQLRSVEAGPSNGATFVEIGLQLTKRQDQ